jgi:hypothetical protein
VVDIALLIDFPVFRYFALQFLSHAPAGHGDVLKVVTKLIWCPSTGATAWSVLALQGFGCGLWLAITRRVEFVAMFSDLVIYKRPISGLVIIVFFAFFRIFCVPCQSCESFAPKTPPFALSGTTSNPSGKHDARHSARHESNKAWSGVKRWRDGRRSFRD